MLARADSSGIPGPSAASPPAFPAWARLENPPQSTAEAAFFAGAALAPPRRSSSAKTRPRPALAASASPSHAAAASVARSGRSEAEAGLRDALPPHPTGRRPRTGRPAAAAPGGRYAPARPGNGAPPSPVAAEALVVPAGRGAASGGRRRGKLRRRRRSPRRSPRAKAFALGSRRLRRAGQAWRPGRGGRTAGRLARRSPCWRKSCIGRSPCRCSRRAVRRRRAPGRERRRRGRADDPHSVRLCACGGAGLRSRRRAWPARAKAAARPRQSCAPRARGRRCRPCSTTIALSAATRIKGLSERGARRLFERLVALGADPRTHRTHDVPAVRALDDGAAEKIRRALDRELEDLPPAARWREWLARVEAVIFASRRSRSPGKCWRAWSAKPARSSC